MNIDPKSTSSDPAPPPLPQTQFPKTIRLPEITKRGALWALFEACLIGLCICLGTNAGPAFGFALFFVVNGFITIIQIVNSYDRTSGYDGL